jgi:hypothetical protein
MRAPPSVLSDVGYVDPGKVGVLLLFLDIGFRRAHLYLFNFDGLRKKEGPREVGWPDGGDGGGRFRVPGGGRGCRAMSGQGCRGRSPELEQMAARGWKERGRVPRA